MREGWSVVTLGELIDENRPITYGVVQPGDHDPAGIPLVRGGDFSFGWRPIEDYRRVSPEIEKSFARARLKTGDLVITIKGDVGTAAIVPSYLEGANISQTNARVAIAPHKALAEIVLAFLQTNDGGRQIAAVTQIGAQPGLIFRDIEALTLQLPPLAEQRTIARILRVWDEAIEACERLAASKKLHIKGLSHQFFEPCHPKSEARPSGWTRFELGDVFIERDQPGGDDDRLLSITMSGGVIDRDDVGRKDVSKEDKSSYKLILPGDIGYNTMRMWQGVSGLSTLRGIVSPAYTIVTPDNQNIDARYAAHLFKSRRMVFDFERYSQGLTSDTWNLKFPAFSKIVVYLPSMLIQRQQATVMDALLEEVSMIERKRDALSAQKRGLMQKLLTGEWRVKPEGSDG
jgi:type I restriction enzyme S subunit